MEALRSLIELVAGVTYMSFDKVHISDIDVCCIGAGERVET